jgi:hypothetical protein
MLRPGLDLRASLRPGHEVPSSNLRLESRSDRLSWAPAARSSGNSPPLVDASKKLLPGGTGEDHEALCVRPHVTLRCIAV